MDNRADIYKSHVLLPKQLMKPYSIKQGKEGKVVNVLHLPELNITQEKINDLDAEEKYFHPVIEDFLDKQIESKFSNVIDKVRGFLFKKQDIKLTRNDLQIIRKFFQFTFARSKEVFQSILDGSVLLKHVSGITHSVLFGYVNGSDYIFDKKRVSFIVNETNNKHGFVCPHNVVYYFYNEDEKRHNLAITISSKLIVCLNIDIEDDKNVNIMSFHKDEDIDLINTATYITEKNHKSQYIIGNIEDLERLKQKIPLIKTDLISIVTVK